MVERFSGRMSDVLKTNHFDGVFDLELTLVRYVPLYKTQLPHVALKCRTPIRTMMGWHES